MLTPQQEARLQELEQKYASQAKEARLQELEQKYSSLSPNKEEASLGFANRARYAIEPLASNREALLVQQFGQENVQKDQNGNLYVRQNGQFLPVNKEGFSTADLADFAGATPELAGMAAGTVMGGGAASVPGLILGGMAGSAIRQSLSGALGTPQVAGLQERAIETGLSGVGNLVGGKVLEGLGTLGTEIKQGASNAIGKIGSVFRSSEKPLAKEVGVVADQILNPVMKDTNQVVKENVPGMSVTPLDEPFGKEMVVAEQQKLNEIAARQRLPKSTYAQAAGGNAIQAEGKILDTPFVGGDVKRHVEGQLKAVKKNLENIAGEFIHSDSTDFEVGSTVRDMAKEAKLSAKRISQEMYDQVDQAGQNAMIGKYTFYKKFRDKAGELGLINPDGSRAVYDSSNELMREEFDTLQGLLFDGIDAIKKNPSNKVPFRGINAQIKKIGNAAKKLEKSDPNISRLLNIFKDDLENTAERTLNREVPRLGGVYKEARTWWKKFKDEEEFLDNLLPENIGDEKVVAKVMNDTTRIKGLKNIIGDEAVSDIGKSHVKNILQKLGNSGVASASTALNAVKKQRAQIIEALGEKTYKNIVDNLYYLNRVNRGLNIQRPRLMDLITQIGGWKNLAIRLATTTKTYAEMKGMEGTKDLVKEKAKSATKTIAKPGNYLLEKSKAPGFGNLLTDPYQRKASDKYK